MIEDWQKQILEQDAAVDWVLFYEQTKRKNPHLSETQVKEFCTRLFNERGGKCPTSAG